MIVTALYGGLLVPIFVLLSIRVIGRRRVAKVALGAGEDRALLRRMRVHANFAEYVPIALVLMGLLESMQASPYLLHALGATLLTGRLVHAFGVSQEKENLSLRVAGMAMTFTVLITASLACLAMAALGMVKFGP